MVWNTNLILFRKMTTPTDTKRRRIEPPPPPNLTTSGLSICRNCNLVFRNESALEEHSKTENHKMVLDGLRPPFGAFFCLLCWVRIWLKYFWLKGVSSKPSGKHIVAPIFLFFEFDTSNFGYLLVFNFPLLCKVSARLDKLDNIRHFTTSALLLGAASQVCNCFCPTIYVVVFFRRF